MPNTAAATWRLHNTSLSSIHTYALPLPPHDQCIELTLPPLCLASCACQRFDGDPRTDIVEPAVAGTEAVLRSAARQQQPGQRIVVTSSVCGALLDVAYPVGYVGQPGVLCIA